MNRNILLICFLHLCISAPCQTITGKVYHAGTKQAIGNANVRLLSSAAGTVSDGRGEFTMKQVSAGAYQLQVSHVGYETFTLPVAIVTDSSLVLEIALKSSVVGLNKGIVVTAQRYPTEQFFTAQAISLLGGPELQQRSPRTTPEALMGTTGVWIQKTNHGGGSPFLRGLTGQQTLLLIDGIRLNNATFRSGPNQYFNTIDPQSIEQIEVLKGSGSVQYGSDALGGVIGVYTKDPSFTGSRTFTGMGYAKYMSGGMEKSGRVEAGYSSPYIALTGGFSLRSFGDMVAGKNIGKLHPTGYDQVSGDIKVKLRLRSNYLLTMAHQQLHQQKVPIYHKVQLENYRYSYFDPQKRQLSYARLEAFYDNKWWRTIRVTMSLQEAEEGRISRKNESDIITNERDKVRTYGATFQINSVPAPYWTIQSGIEYYDDVVKSSRQEMNELTQTVIHKRGLYPDGARSASVALFSLHRVQLNKLQLSAGGRLNTFALSVPQSTQETATITPHALVGNIAALYSLHPSYQLIASVNTAFRAPNIDDMGTLGIVDYRYEVPNSNLAPEKSLNIEVGTKVKTSMLAASVFLYRNQLSNIISRVRSGNDSINGYQVYKKENVADAYIQGVEAEAELQLLKQLSIYTGLTYTYGQSITGNEPFRRIPPLNGRVGLYYQKKGIWSRLEYFYASRQDRLAQGDIDDNRIAAGGTPSWSIVNLLAGYQYKWLSVSGEFHNILNEAYRTHGSGVEGYGRSLWLSVRAQFN